MSSTIRVQPAARLRRDFAVWATAQTPKVRTVAPNTFAVPVDLYVDCPDEILIGALVDGHRYVSPAEDAALGTPPPAAPAPMLGEQWAEPGQALPELPAEEYGPDAVPLPPPDYAPLEDAPADDEDQDQAEDSDRSDSPDEEAADGSSHGCEDCGRPFGTPRGLTVHRRQKHPEGA